MIIWLRPYSKIDYKDWSMKASIVAFGKRTVTLKSEYLGNGHYRTVPSKYRYTLHINLWLICLLYHWEKEV